MGVKYSEIRKGVYLNTFFGEAHKFYEKTYCSFTYGSKWPAIGCKEVSRDVVLKVPMEYLT